MNRALSLVPLGAALLVWSQPLPAQACGGFFCNRPPPDGTLPIAQAAENVLFVLDRDPASGANTVEAHIQILYTGPASEFSWIVPVTSVPTVTVGADILFDRIEPPTRPRVHCPGEAVEARARHDNSQVGPSLQAPPQMGHELAKPCKVAR